ncbi:MAG: NUDIX domain-containing protein [Clostridia bacterium]|nr:NUDIX domain-containing protein [Clostridia bacterium]
MRYSYCPDCGARLAERSMGDEGLVPYCEGCARPWFDGFYSAVCVLAINERGEAVMQRQSEFSKDRLNLVTGFIKPGETAAQAAIREVKEETGLFLEAPRTVDTYWYKPDGVFMVQVIGRVKKAPFRLSTEVEDAQWVPLKEAVVRGLPEGTAVHDLLSGYLSGRYAGR